MAESERQEKMLSETIVKEAVGLGMKSPLRDSIVEAVDDAEGGPSGGGSRLPLAGALFGAGAALGFLAGRQSPELEETSLEDIQEPEIIEDVMEGGADAEEAVSEMTETEDETETEGGSGRLMQFLLAVGAIAAVAVLRRRQSGGEEEEWEPIEEFEPATGDETEESEADDEESEEPVEAEAETEDADEEEE